MTQTLIQPRVRKMARPADSESSQAELATTTDVIPTTAAATTKASVVLALLRREEGAALQDMVDATGWLPHTTRAFLAGLRKKGYVIARDKIDGVSR